MAGPKVFISYSHDSEEHKQRVRWLSDRLRGDSVEAWIDLYELAPPQGWTQWMWDRVDWADFVLVVCTETYKRRARRKEEPDKGHGVIFEAALLIQRLHDNGMHNESLVPVLLDGATEKDIPDPLRGYTFHRIVEGDDGGYEGLLRHLLDKPKYLAPELGTSAPDLDPEPSSSFQGTSTSTSSTSAFYNVPFGTEFFTGRESHLEELERRLQSEHSVAITQAIVGLGGIGKTQVAIEYCKRHNEKYPDGVFWVDASSAATLTATYAECAKGLRLVPRDAKEDEGVAALMGYLGQKSRWLVVMDNADTPKEVHSLKPKAGHGHVLVTTRDQDCRMGPGEPLRLDCWSIPEATEFLLERVGRGEEGGARELAEALEGLPLALEQAGAYLKDSTLSFGGYLKEYQAINLDFLEEHKPVEGDYGKKTVAKTWVTSIERLKEESPAALEALNACAFLDPESIPIRIFQDAGEHLGPELEMLDLADRSVLHEQVVRPLNRYSLAKWDPDSKALSVHRLVQMVSRWRLGEEATKVLDRVYAALRAIFPEEYKDPSTWDEGAVLLSHVSSSAKFWGEENGVEVAQWLWFSAGSLAWKSGRNALALAIRGKALESCREVLGEENTSTLTAMNQLALTFYTLGDLTGAKELHEQALAARHRIQGPEHPDTLMSMNNLAATLSDLGDTADAKELEEQILEARRRILGPEHPDTLQSMNNLAATLSDLGDTTGAKEMHEHVLEVRRRILGPEHPDTLISMNNLAATLSDLGDTTGAKEMQEQVLEARRRILGPEHPDTLISIWWMGTNLKNEGDLAGAKKHLSAALQGFFKTLGKEHPHTKSTARSLLSLEENTE